MRRLSCVLLTLLATVIFPVTQAAHAAVAAPAAPSAIVRATEHPEALPALAAQVSYRVRPGDTLSSVSGRFLGTARAWPDLWWANRATVHDPDVLAVGTILAIPSWHPVPPPGWLMAAALRAAGAVSGTVVTTSFVQHPAPVSGFPGYGLYSFSMLEQVWIWAGGPAGDAWAAATIAECESGGKTWAHNPSGATGLWQILGVPWPGNPWDGPTNARMAVTKFRDAGGFSPWVCQA